MQEIKEEKKEGKKNNAWETQGEGAIDRGGKEEGITDGGKLGKHGSHNSDEYEVIRIMCESIELLSVTLLSAPRK